MAYVTCVVCGSAFERTRYRGRVKTCSEVCKKQRQEDVIAAYVARGARAAALKRRRAKNHAQFIAYERRWRRINKVKSSTYSKNWREKNREKVKQRQCDRSARERAAYRACKELGII